MCSASADDFAGTERFSIESRLGSGSFGVVYRSFDRKRGGIVALKTLRRAESDALYRFKQEFRSLADITHPNLVTLYELLSAADQWFFTMELVEGTSFLDYVRGISLRRSSGSGEETPVFDASGGGATLDPLMPGETERELLGLGLAQAAEAEGGASPFDEIRLRAALRQLGEGLHALHAAKKLHRDIKPSNVLVTAEGRVVLLDFGLVSDIGPEGFHQSIHLVGTPAYMSPEQAAGRPVTEASDWYGVGVMLYEALTGVRPFPGEYLDVLVEKQRSEPAAPRSLAPTVPEDLDSICRSLLRRDPLGRPSEDDILRLFRSAAPEPGASRPAIESRAAPFVGRLEQLRELASAFEKTKAGCAVATIVRGSSGVGKTALVRHFLKDLRRREPGAVILTGRSYEQETVPYKALDSLVDALSQHLKKLAPGETEALLPRDLLALVRLFPVLRQVDAVALARRRVVAIPDSLEQRRRGFRALRELFGRLADRAPLVLFVDDLQWGDADSAALLSELLRAPDSPPVLFIGCFRVDEASENPLLRVLRGLHSPGTSDLEIRELPVGDLPQEEAKELAGALVDVGSAPGAASAESIARESRGNPFFIDELARHLRAGAPLADGAVSLDDVIWARVSELPEEARRLLEAVAVAGRPLDRATARRAAAITEDDQSSLAVLRVGRLLRGAGTESEEQIEIYHDRIRQTVVSRLSAQAQELAHRRLAFALESSVMPDPESLAIHYQAAGSRERAAIYAADAAAKATEALAFDRAARLYKLALELGTTDAVARQSLRVKLGDSLANAGRGAEAAHVYLSAAEGASAAETLELQRRAAEQLLRSGHVDEGLAVFRKVFDRFGMKLPATPRMALLSFLLRRIQLWLRGLSFRERSASEIPAEDLLRIDVCWSVAAGLSLIDTIRGRDFQTRHMILALRAGEPYRVARAMGMEAGYTAYLGGWQARFRTQKLVDRAMALSERVKHPHALGMTYLGAGLAAYLEGRWQAGWDLAQQCEQILRDQCTGVAWELDMAHVYSLRALVLLGGLRELAERLPKLLKEAGERGDLFAAISLRTRHSYVVRLMSDEPEKAREGLQRAAEKWSKQGFFMQHFFYLTGDTEISLYSGSGQAARKSLLEKWWALERSLMLRAQAFRIPTRHLRARCALAAAGNAGLTASSRNRLLRSALRDARRIEREKTPWGDPLARSLRAGVASHRGDRKVALECLVSAEAGFDAARMALYAAAARRCRGLLLGGEGGLALVASADAWMRGERIKNPERMSAMLAPGRWAPD
jgi:serine/threonine protein kinase